MAIKDVLLYVDSSDGTEDLIDIAANFADEHDAHLTGVYVVQVLPINSYGATAIPAEVLRIHHDNQLKAANEARTLFETRVSKLNVQYGWRTATDDADNAFVDQLRYADLAILRQADEKDIYTKRFVNNVLLDSGKPVLVIPRFGWDKSIGKHVTIAWKQTKEASRAVSDAIPILQGADTVEVLTVQSRNDDPDSHESIALSEHLARHGINVKARELSGSDISVANQILNFTFDQGCDLLVMGAWGHSRMREAVFGGASNQILDSMTLPVLMSH